MTPNDIVRFKDEQLNNMFGIGIVKKELEDDYYEIAWCDVTCHSMARDRDVLILSNAMQAWGVCNRIVEHKGACDATEVDCVICPFNRSRKMNGQQTCGIDHHRLAHIHNGICEHLLKLSIKAANFIHTEYKS